MWIEMGFDSIFLCHKKFFLNFSHQMHRTSNIIIYEDTGAKTMNFEDISL